MHVGFYRVGHLVIDDERDVLHVDTTSGEVGGDENVGMPVAERLQRRFSLFLVLARVQRRGAPLQSIQTHRKSTQTDAAIKKGKRRFGRTPAR